MHKRSRYEAGAAGGGCYEREGTAAETAGRDAAHHGRERRSQGVTTLPEMLGRRTSEGLPLPTQGLSPDLRTTRRGGTKSLTTGRKPPCTLCPQCGRRFDVSAQWCADCRLDGDRVRLWLLKPSVYGTLFHPPNSLNKEAQD